MKNKLLFVCIIGILVMSVLNLTGCDQDCEEKNACHGIVTNGVFTGSASCGMSTCVIETMKNNAAQIQNSGGIYFCNCED